MQTAALKYAAFGIFGLVAACQTSSKREAATGSGVSTAVSYNGWTQQFLTTNCASAGCHVTGKQAPDLSTYAAAKTNASAALASMQSKSMPPSGALGASVIAQFQSWISGGYLQTAVVAGTGTTSYTGTVATTGSTTTVTAPTYLSWVQGYLAQSCNSCHSAGGQDAALDLTTYNAAAQNAQQILASMKSSMPLNSAPATADAINQMSQWVAANAPYSVQPAGSATSVLGGTYTGATGTLGSGAAVTYLSDVQSILQTYCLSCHATNGVASPDLSTQANAQLYNSQIYSDSASGRMPTSGAPVPAAALAKLQTWVSTGAQ